MIHLFNKSIHFYRVRKIKLPLLSGLDQDYALFGIKNPTRSLTAHDLLMLRLQRLSSERVICGYLYGKVYTKHTDTVYENSWCGTGTIIEFNAYDKIGPDCYFSIKEVMDTLANSTYDRFKSYFGEYELRSHSVGTYQIFRNDPFQLELHCAKIENYSGKNKLHHGEYSLELLLHSK